MPETLVCVLNYVHLCTFLSCAQHKTDLPGQQHPTTPTKERIQQQKHPQHACSQPKNAANPPLSPQILHINTPTHTTCAIYISPPISLHLTPVEDPPDLFRVEVYDENQRLVDAATQVTVPALSEHQHWPVAERRERASELGAIDGAFGA